MRRSARSWLTGTNFGAPVLPDVGQSMSVAAPPGCPPATARASSPAAGQSSPSGTTRVQPLPGRSPSISAMSVRRPGNWLGALTAPTRPSASATARCRNGSGVAIATIAPGATPSAATRRASDSTVRANAA